MTSQPVPHLFAPKETDSEGVHLSTNPKIDLLHHVLAGGRATLTSPTKQPGILNRGVTQWFHPCRTWTRPSRMDRLLRLTPAPTTKKPPQCARKKCKVVCFPIILNRDFLRNTIESQYIRVILIKRKPVRSVNGGQGKTIVYQTPPINVCTYKKVTNPSVSSGVPRDWRNGAGEVDSPGVWLTSIATEDIIFLRKSCLSLPQIYHLETRDGAKTPESPEWLFMIRGPL
jgi:hypothetical protein